MMPRWATCWFAMEEEGDGRGRTHWLWFRPGRKEEEREEGRGMLGALCWNFLVAETQVFLPHGKLVIGELCAEILITHSGTKLSIIHQQF